MRRSRAPYLLAIVLAVLVRPAAIHAQTELLNGQNVVGTISVPGEFDQYFFYATAGEAVILSIAEVGPEVHGFTPSILFHCGPYGTLGQAGGQIAAQVEAVVPATTTCFVLVSGGVQTAGSYLLTIARTPGAFTVSPADEGGPLVNGSNQVGTIHVGDLDMWSFTASAGDAIMVGIGEVGSGSSFMPWIRLKGPTGQNLGSSSGNLVGRIETTAPATGTYTVIVSTSAVGGFEPSGSGDYSLSLIRTPGPYTVSAGDEGGELTNGAHHTGAIHAGDLDVWTVTASAGDSILVSMAEVGGDTAFRPWMQLRSPTGQSLGSSSDARGARLEAAATVAGVYTVVVASGTFGLEASGTYTLTLAQAPRPFVVPVGDEGGPAINGSNHTGVIPIGDLDMWTFEASAGSAIVVSIGETGGDSDFAPRIRLRRPAGPIVTTSQSGGTAARIFDIATVTGTYVVIVDTSDTGLDGVGNYTLTIAVAPGVPFTISGGDQGGPLAPGENAGAIHPGDVDAWTLAAEAGDVVRSATTVLSGTGFSPWLLVLGPSGPMPFVPMGGPSPVPYNFVAPETGVYTFVVASSSTEGIGSYSINASTGSAMIRNGSFDEAESHWQFFATPTLDYVVHEVTNGLLEYYRVPPPPGTSNQAVAFQHTGIMVPAGQPLLARFDLANTSAARKRITALVLDTSFGDLSVCTFWLEPHAPMRTYQVRTYTTAFWANAAIYFYAATAGEDGGRYQIDNVSLDFATGQAADRTDCVDPTAPAPSGGPPGPNLLVNGDFNTGALEPWFTFGTITALVFNGTLNFSRPFSTPPAGVVAQQTGQSIPAGEIVTAAFIMGNGSNGGRRRVTVIVHDADFSDLSACTFWLEPGQPRLDYVMRAYTGKPWTNAMLSIYPATVAFTPSLTLDNVTFQRTPDMATTGTECVEPASSVAPATASPKATRSGTPNVVGVTKAASGISTKRQTTEPDANAPPITGAIDLRSAIDATLRFESSVAGLSPTSVRGLVQVSLDGTKWVTVEAVPASDDWSTVHVDLSGFAGELVRIRFVLADTDDPFHRPQGWRIRGLNIAIR